MITVENEFTTPFGMALTISMIMLVINRGRTHAANTEVKRIKAFGSTNALSACFLLKDLFLIPVSFPATRLTAISRSFGLRKRALEGASGNKK